jgi:hypothetical protein
MSSDTLKRARDRAQSLGKAIDNANASVPYKTQFGEADHALPAPPLIGGGAYPKVPDTRVTLTLTHDLSPAPEGLPDAAFYHQHRIVARRGDDVYKGEFVGTSTYASLIVEGRLFIAVTDYFQGGPLIAGHVYEVKR